MTQQFAAPIDQAWLGLWVSLFGRQSKLAKFLNDERRPNVDWSQPTIPRSPALDDQARKQQSREPGSTPLGKSASRKRHSHPQQTGKVAPEERQARRIARDVDRVTRMPTSDWAKRIVGDPRISGVTLEDIIDGIENYFEIFDQLRCVNPDAHKYFSRVGAPIISRNHMAWESSLTALRVANPAELPSYFGAFFSRTNEEFRKDSTDEIGSGGIMDFQLFEKPKNHGTVAPLGTTVFSHSTYSLKRDHIFTKRELKHREYEWAATSWGFWWYLGVGPDGSIMALPHRMQRYQRLPGGNGVHHSEFQIPRALYEMSTKTKDPHEFVRMHFNLAVAFTASAISGMQVSIKKGKRAARFGIPVASVKNFFADRDVSGDRRKAIIHLILGHDRHMADGRIVSVGEHLRGERKFSWRGYDVTVGVPGVHYASPEGFSDQLITVGDPDAPVPDDVDIRGMIQIGDAGKIIGKMVRNRKRVQIRRGEPTWRYPSDTLPEPKRFSRASIDHDEKGS